MEQTLEQFLSKGILNQASIELLIGAWKSEITLNKNDYLLKSNQKENYLYFIKTGCIAPVVEEEKVAVLGFGYQGSIITSFISYSTEVPDKMALLAISNTTILKISKAELINLVNSSPNIAKWYYSIIEETLVGHLKRQIELLTLNPTEKYNAFIQRSGHLVNTIPLKYISSYLNMTPETLSRVRKSIS